MTSGFFAIIIPSMWQDLAACAGMDTDLFFPRENIGGPQQGRGVAGERERIRQAMMVCRQCPVRQDCLEYAINLDCVGIWGGMDTRARRRYAEHHQVQVSDPFLS